MLTDTKVPYEILIRFGTDGHPRGAHCQYLRRVVLDGEVLKEEIGPAQPIDLGGFPTSEIMTTATQAALAQVTSLNTTIATLQDQLEAAQAALQEASQGRDDATEAKIAAETDLTSVQSELTQKGAQLTEAQAAIATLQEEATARLAQISALTEQLAAGISSTEN